eukprot:TRINITY_DN4923_c0_g1_i1.p1 TRINITY_DN4923_c0_g1~~TRINITY_DN4923_c0_g1_i1.p1  ORF type:complete len:155 (-),score=40.51 TRINITY_DN4923_c0_g1_i1:136-561(-)
MSGIFGKLSVPVGCIAALGGMFAMQSLAVSAKRGETDDGTKGDLVSFNAAVRSHRNAAEYLGLLSTTFLYFHFNKRVTPNWVDYIIISTTVGRILLSLGLYGDQSRGPTPSRSIGAMLMYGGIITLPMVMVWQEIKRPLLL